MKGREGNDYWSRHSTVRCAKYGAYKSKPRGKQLQLEMDTIGPSKGQTLFSRTTAMILLRKHVKSCRMPMWI
jgi:hypothetical protein